MKILLIVYDNHSYIHWFPLGTAYIASALRNAGHKIMIYNQDMHHYPDEHLTEYLNKNKFDAVGMGVIAGYHQYRKIVSLSKAINRSNKRPFFFIGGHGPSPEPEFFLEKTKADAIIIGEGDMTIVELMTAYEKKEPFNVIKGIAWKDGKTITINDPRPLVSDIDSLPMPAYDLFPVEYYRLLRLPNAQNTDFVMPMVSGRGCPFKCTFCYRMDEGFRPRSNEAIIEEIMLLKKQYGITYIAFADELLMSSEKRTISICEDFLKHNLDIKWECNGRLNYAKPEVLDLMKRSGCVFINYGVEAIDDTVLKNMKKALTTKQIIKGVEQTLSAGISPGLNVIFGNLGDNKKTLDKAVAFLLKYDDGAQMRTIRPVTPYPGTELYQMAKEQGKIKNCEDFYENIHINSDLLAVNFTELTDDEFHGCLLEANSRLIKNYYSRKQDSDLEQAKLLYIENDKSFRGFRQT